MAASIKCIYCTQGHEIHGNFDGLVEGLATSEQTRKVGTDVKMGGAVR